MPVCDEAQRGAAGGRGAGAVLLAGADRRYADFDGLPCPLGGLADGRYLLAPPQRLAGPGEQRPLELLPWPVGTLVPVIVKGPGTGPATMNAFGTLPAVRTDMSSAGSG